MSTGKFKPLVLPERVLERVGHIASEPRVRAENQIGGAA
jgi:hypothetical protein